MGLSKLRKKKLEESSGPDAPAASAPPSTATSEAADVTRSMSRSLSRLMAPRPLWGNKAPTAAAEGRQPPAPGGLLGMVRASSKRLPVPMWRNKVPTTAPAASALPPAPSAPSASTRGSTVGDARWSSLADARWSSVDATKLSSEASLQLKPKKYIRGADREFELGSTLGRGSYAKVKEGVDTESGEVFAVKVFKTSLLKRRRLWDSRASGFKTAFDDVLREIAIMKRLTHENVMNMHDVIDDPTVNKLYMVMDLCPGGAIMESEALPCAPLPVEATRRYMADAVVGLEYLHFQGVVHSDLKPDNILVAEDGRAVISDFGVSRLSSTSDRTIGSPGTPAYTAPEVWGEGKYAGKIADVWSLGVTLHAMAFGCLPFDAPEQTALVALVTSPAEWSCAHACKDAGLLDLLAGLLQKDPAARSSLGAVKAHRWLRDELRRRGPSTAWTLIEVNEAELRQAVISGHVANFRRTKDGTLHKLTDANEEAMYRMLAEASPAIGRFLPELKSSKRSSGKRVIMELQDLTHGLAQPCLMDVKMGLRTFTDADAESTAMRADLLAKLLKVSPDAATPEEIAAGGMTKLRYLKCREDSTSTKTLGFRIDAVQLHDECPDAPDVPDVDDLRRVTSPEQVRTVFEQYLQRRASLAALFLPELVALRSALEECHLFSELIMIRTSLLFVYCNVSKQAMVRIIDLPKAHLAGSSPSKGGAKRTLNHRESWVAGNHEDGYLKGLDNIISIFEQMVASIGGKSSKLRASSISELPQ